MSKDDKKRYLILKDSNIYKGLLIMALPLMLNNFLKTFHDFIDMFFVGRIPGRGVEAIEAIQLTFPVVFTFLALGIGLMVAGTALISQFMGSNQLEDARKYASQLLVLSFILGVVLNVVSYFGAPLFFNLMGVDPGYTYDSAVSYLQWRAFELPVLFMFFSYMATRQASGDTISPVIISGTAIILNTILSPLLITTFGFGVAGAAMATLIANVVVMPVAIYALFFAKSGVTVSFKYMRLERGVVKDIVKTAVPASLGQAITAIGFGVMNAVIYNYGDSTLAAFGVGNRIVSMLLHPVMAIGGVLSAYIGQNIGAQNTERAKLTFRKAMILSTGMMAVGAFIFLFIRRPLAGIFIVDNQVALDLASDYMFFILIGLPLMGVFQTFMGTYNGTGNTHFSFILSVTRLWLIRVPLVIFMRDFTNLGASGIWYSMLASNFLIAIIGIFLYLKIDFKPKIRVGPKVKRPLPKPSIG